MKPSIGHKYEFLPERQPVMGIYVLILAVIISFLLQFDLAISWGFGLLVGFILQRSRICFTAVLRDPFLFGLTGVTRGIILSLMVTTIGFALVQYFYYIEGLPLPGRFLALGLNIPVGAFIFGLGAAISGGCASGTLVRLGEGFQLQWFVLIGFVIGSAHGAHDAGWWYQLFSNVTLHLPSVFGWIQGVLVQLFFLFLLYFLAIYWEKYKLSK